MKDLQVVIEDNNIAKNSAQQLIDVFGAPFTEAGKIIKDYESIVVTSEDQLDIMAEAKTKRLLLKRVRTTVENKRKELKEDSLRTGKAIDAVAKYIKDTITPVENYLELQEMFAKTQQAKRDAEKRELRLKQLTPYTDNPFMYDYFSMTEEMFTELVDTLKLQHERKLEEERRVEEQRIAKEKFEAEEQERVRAENLKLRKEAEERDAREIKERKQREAEQRIAQDKLDEERKKREALEAEQRAEREKLETERKQHEEEIRQSLLAPDKEKLLMLATKIEATELPALASKDAQAVLNQVEELLARVSKYIRGNVKGL
jgi:hypothetical protein